MPHAPAHRRSPDDGALRRAGVFCAAAALCAATLFAGTGCRAKSKRFDNENDELRRRVAILEQERDAAAARAGEAESKLHELLRTRETIDEREALEALPRLAGLQIGRLTGYADFDAEGGARFVDVYIRPFDGRMRFVQVAGRMTVEALLLDGSFSEDAAPPRRLASATLSPAALREAYRSSPLGVHYSVRLSMPEPIHPDAGTLVVRVELIDPIGGQVHRAERIITPFGR